MNKEHRKHAKLPRPKLGEWGRSELALLGAPCGVIREFAEAIARKLSPSKIAFVDAAHSSEDSPAESALSVQLVKKQAGSQVSFVNPLSSFQQHALFNGVELVLLNGNHFKAAAQIVFITDEKPLESKSGQLSDVRLVLLKEKNSIIPEMLKPFLGAAPVLLLEEINQITAFFENYLQQQAAPLNGLVLAGGQSKRMGRDKSLLNYHGKAQRDVVYDLLKPLCREVYISCNAQQSPEIALPKIEDRFLGVGPMAGLLSAFQMNPDAAWLTVACDLPFLSSKTLDYLVSHRNASAMATVFMNEESNLPEPLITIWEPRAYPVLLQALGEGYSCPRKLLMNSDIAILEAPDRKELQNINDLPAYGMAAVQLNPSVQNESH